MSKRRGQLVAACFAMFSIGFIYAWSVFNTPITDEFHWEPTTLAFTFTMLMWAQCAGGFIGAKICSLTGSRVTIIIAAVCILTAFASTSFLARADAPWILFLTYGLLGGLGVGIAYTVVMATTLSWFPDKAGTASGLLLLCYGTSTMILSSAAAWLFSFMEWRVAFTTIAVGIAALLIICGAVLLRRATEEETALLPKRATQSGKSSDDARSYTPREMLRTPAFWTFILWMIPLCTMTNSWTSVTNQFAIESGAQPAVAVALVGAYSVCNGVGRLLFGIIYDKLAAFRTMLIVSIARGLGALAIVLAIVFHSVPLMAFALVFAGISTGGVPVSAAGFAATTFGPKHYATNLSCVNLANIPAALAGPMIMSFSVTATGGYAPGLAVGFVLTAIAIVFTFVTKKLLARM